MKGESQTESIQIEMKKDEVKEFDSDECKEFTSIFNHHRGLNVLIITIIIMMMTLTETFREPLRLVIMFNRHRACVQEDQDDNLGTRSITIMLHAKMVKMMRIMMIITSQNHHCCLHIRRTQNLNFFSVSMIPVIEDNNKNHDNDKNHDHDHDHHNHDDNHHIHRHNHDNREPEAAFSSSSSDTTFLLPSASTRRTKT